MIPTDDLKDRIKQRRDEILRAELAGHLHVMGRMRTGRGEPGGPIVQKLVTAPSWTDAMWNQAAESVSEDKREQFLKGLRSFLNRPCPLPESDDLLNSVPLTLPPLQSGGMPDEWPLGLFLTVWNQPFVDRRKGRDPVSDYLAAGHVDGICPSPRLFQQSHARASDFKTGPPPKGVKRQADGNTQPPKKHSTIFGYESDVQRLEIAGLKTLVESGIAYGRAPQLESRRKFLEVWRDWAGRSPADYGKPRYDLDNWIYGDTVAAFFKTAVARLWAEDRWPKEGAVGIEWRFLSVGYPGLDYLGSAVRITDTIARRDWLAEMLDSIQRRLEFDVPIAHQIYRDENGAIFLMAEFKGQAPLLEGLAREEIRDCGGTYDDWRARVTAFEWKDQGVEKEDEGWSLPPLWEAIESLNQGDAPSLAHLTEWWKNARVNSELCPVCGLRPHAEKGSGQQRELCETCFDRRSTQERCSTWRKSTRQTTIWIDEAADCNGICALMVGSIGLEGWLHYPWETKKDGDSSEPVNYFHYLANKHPDFMRLRACWETTQTFWSSVEKELRGDRPGRRLCLELEPSSIPRTDFAYETTIGGAQLSAVWTGKEFLTTSSLAYVAKDAGLRGKDALEQLRLSLLREAEITFTLPRGYEKGDAGSYESHDLRLEAKAIRGRLKSASFNSQGYSPCIPLLAEPRHFFLIAPAQESLTFAEYILDAYHSQFGKVAGMLPIRVGLVFFDRRTPIYAVMQAGQKMLRMPGRRFDPNVQSSMPLPLDKNGSFASLMDDVDFARVRKDNKGTPETAKNLEGKFLYDLSSVDFLHLETTGHRYQLAYSNTGRMEPDRGHLPLSIEGFYEMQTAWKTLKKGLHSSQITPLFAAIEGRREEWGLRYGATHPALQQFAGAVLANAEWSPKPSDADLKRLQRAAAEGWLRDAIEVYTKVLKPCDREGGAE